ncbi:cytochrome B [Pseudomonas lini]
MKAETLRLWDPLVRVCHWSLVVVFISDYFLNEEGDGWHRWLGYYAVAVVLVRVVWGVRRSAIGALVRLLADPDAARSAWSGAVFRQGLSPHGALAHRSIGDGPHAAVDDRPGYQRFLMEEVDYFWGEDWLRDVHEFMADALLALVCVHILAALVESLRLREKPAPVDDHGPPS